ncbi:MAG: triose-phosphate isomerase [Candidatus Dormiibacterota bacterium]
MNDPARRPLVAGNWKMHTSVPEAINLTTEIRQKLAPQPLAEVLLLPPYISLWPVQQLLVDEPRIGVGAQDCYWEKSGAYTGQVSAAMLRDSCQYLLVGHSERRHLFGDDDAAVRRKLEAGLEAGLTPLLAVGETESERTAHSTEAVLQRQVNSALSGLPESDLRRCLLAYEPVWAIGTGRAAQSSDVSAAIAGIRALLDEISAGSGATIRVLYGGSVSAESAHEVLDLAQVDGALVGGASLDADDFCAIVAAAAGPAA